MKIKLTPSAKVELENRHKKERDKRVCDRIKAVLAYDDGYTYAEIGRLLLLDDGTIRRHVEEYYSTNKLLPENGGSASYLNAEQTEMLKSKLREKTYVYVKDICNYVKEKHGQTYSVSGMTKWLQANGFCYKKPHGVPAKADDEKQAAFIAYYESLKKSLGDEEALYFVDSSHPQHQTRLAYGWIEKGVRKPMKMTACQKRINLIGAINLAGHAIEYSQVDWVNASSITAFLQQLIDVEPKKKTIHVIWDNAGYHRSKTVVDFAKAHKITLHYLPPYSPNLNPIERLWKVMHEQTTYHRYHTKFSDFTEAILGFFKKIKQFHPIIQARINDNFQRLTLP